MEYIFGSISNQLVSSAALTLIHFIWQAVTIALVLKLSLVLIPQKYLLTRYRLAVLALVVTVAMPGFTFYTLLQSPDIVQSTIDYSSKAIGLFAPELLAWAAGCRFVSSAGLALSATT